MKRFSAWKLIFPASAATIILIFTLFLFKRPEVPVSPDQQPQLPSPKITIPYEEPASQVVPSKEPPELKRNGTIEKEEEVSYQPVRKEKKAPSAVSKTPVETFHPTVRSESSTKTPRTLASAELSHPRPVEKQKPTNISEHSKKMPAVRSVPNSRASEKKDDRPQVAELPPPIATDDEVKNFLNHYTERYNKKDLQGFLSLFSSKAIQNQKDGWGGIRRIYENFFHQSLALRYSMKDATVEVYQNAVEVKARFEVDQILSKDGERKIWKGRIQWMLVKEEGTLKIISLNYKHDGTP